MDSSLQRLATTTHDPARGEPQEKRGIAWESCRLDGCNYGMMDSKNEFFLNKKWLVKTTDEIFWKKTEPKYVPAIINTL